MIIFFVALLFFVVSVESSLYYGGRIGLIRNATWSDNLTGLVQSSLAFGDIDNDGDLDLAVAGCSTGGVTTCAAAGKTRIYINNGTTLTENLTWQQNLTAIGYGSLAFGDIDNDGDLDLAIMGDTGGGNGIVKIYINNGTSLIDNSTWQHDLLGVDAYAGSIVWGDIDNDGDLDLALIGAYPSGNNTIYINNGTSLVKDSSWLEPLPYVGHGDIASLAFGDIDNDGDLDLAFFGEYPGNFYMGVYINNGTSLVENSSWEGNIPNDWGDSSFTFGDYDNDGDLDLAIIGTGGYGDKFYVYNNTGKNFTHHQIIANIYDGSVAWGDYDNDGDLDLVAIGMEEGTNTVANNNKTFFQYDNIARADLREDDMQKGSIVWGDVDNDGDLDLACVGLSYGDGYLTKIYTNNNTVSNNKPLPPNASFSASYANNILTLSWGNGSDIETNTSGLYYNLRVSTFSGGNNIVSGIFGGSSNPTASYFGNMMQRKSISLAIPNLQANTTYYWSVQTIDTGLAKSNWSVEQNYTTPVDITDPTITLNAPFAGFNTTNATIIFNATVYDNLNLSNVTLHGNWGGWHANETNSSGINNTNYIFTKNLAGYGNGYYQWRIRACDVSSNCINSSTRTFAIDTAYPIVALVSPSNASTWTSSSTVTFTYNVTDLAIANCSLIINNAVDQTDTSIEVNTSQTFAKTLSNGNYNWSVNCTDYVGYVNNSLTWKVIVDYTAPPGDGGGGGGGGAGALPTAKFTTDVKEVRAIVTQGETAEKTFNLTNTGDKNISVSLSVEGIDIFLPENTFTLAPKQSKIVAFKFISSSEQAPGVYVGKLIIKADSVEKALALIMEVKRREALFDVKIDIPDRFKAIFPGEEISAEITLTNLGKLGKVDVLMNYFLSDASGKVIESVKETLAVETVTSFVRGFTLTPYTEPGDYNFNINITYKDFSVESSQPFKVKQVYPFLPVFMQKNLKEIIFGIVILLVIIIIVVLIRTLSKERILERREKRLEREVREFLAGKKRIKWQK